MDELNTVSLHDMVARYRTGESGALDALVRRVQDRLDQFARRMLGSFPGVRAREQTPDVVQGALIRLSRALKQQAPGSVAEFFKLAATQVRRELLDLARRHGRRPAGPLVGDPPDPAAGDLAELDRWAALHEAVERLAEEPREVFSYTFYHGWTQAQIAGLLGVSDRQVRRLWVEACLRLKEAVGDLPAG
jgi:RNA polymerase sigma-70 factor (ECF subfamily)